MASAVAVDEVARYQGGAPIDVETEREGRQGGRDDYPRRGPRTNIPTAGNGAAAEREGSLGSTFSC